MKFVLIILLISNFIFLSDSALVYNTFYSINPALTTNETLTNTGNHIVFLNRSVTTNKATKKL